MLKWELLMMNMWQLMLPEPLTSRSIYSWMPSLVFTKCVLLPCIAWDEGMVMERISIRRLNLSLV